MESNLPEWIPQTEWQAFIEMRRKTKHPMTERAVTMAVAELDRLKKLGHDPARVLDQSTFHCWQGLFPLKQATVRPGSDSELADAARQLEWARFLGIANMRRI